MGGAGVMDSKPNKVEQAILGAVLVDNRRYSVIGQIITPDHFTFEPHRKLYKLIAEWIEEGRLADPVTIRNEVDSTGILDECGGFRYMVELLMALPTDDPS